MKTRISAHFKASDMDDSDVHFLNKFGHIALQQQQFDLANAIFQRVNQFHSILPFCYGGIDKLPFFALIKTESEKYGFQLAKLWLASKRHCLFECKKQTIDTEDELTLLDLHLSNEYYWTPE